MIFDPYLTELGRQQVRHTVITVAASMPSQDILFLLLYVSIFFSVNCPSTCLTHSF